MLEDFSERRSSSDRVHSPGMATLAQRLSSRSDSLLQAFDLIGTLVFALQGAMAAIRGELDFLGLLVLATMTRGASYCTAVYRLCPAGDPGACLAWDHSPCT
jgi:hypothetical protein